MTSSDFTVLLYILGAIIWLVVFVFRNYLRPEFPEKNDEAMRRTDKSIRTASWWIGVAYFIIPLLVMIVFPYGALVWYLANFPLAALLQNYFERHFGGDMTLSVWIFISIFNTGAVIFISRFLGRRFYQLI
jgi:hypothetical protein